ncbi:MAG: hypothetical protein WC986_14885 [Elusimicrobiota bacterium]|jgi:hypothetical protein
MNADSSTWFILFSTLGAMLLLIVVSFSVASYLQYREQHPGAPGKPWSNSWAGYLATLVFAISVVVLGLRLAFLEPRVAPPAPATATLVPERWTRLFARADRGLDAGYMLTSPTRAEPTTTAPNYAVTRNIVNHRPSDMTCSFSRPGYARTDIYLRAGERFVFNQDLRNVRCSPDPLPSKSF